MMTLANQIFGTAVKVAGTAAIAIAAVGVFCGQANAINDVVAQWTYEINTPADVTAAAGPIVAAESGTGSMQGIHVSASSAWSTPSGNGSANSYSSNGWGVGDYYQFQTSTTGLVDIGLQFDHVSSTTGPRDFKVQYSTNGTTFTDFSSYAVMPNNVPAWGVTAVSPAGLDTFVFNLSSISAIENATDVYFRLTTSSNVSANGVTTVPAAGTSRIDNVTFFNNFDPTQTPVQQPPTPSVLPQASDIAFGLGSNRGKVTIGLLRGPATAAGGVSAGGGTYGPWQSTPFVTNVRFDNLGGTAHNVAGNLVGVDGGASAVAGGNIYSFGTQGTTPLPAGQLLTNTGGAVGGTRIGGLSVSPNNSKIAVAGFDSGTVIVYDYTAGNTLGAGAAVANKRETAATLTTASTQGTVWKNDSTVLALNTSGELYEVAVTAGSATASPATTLTLPSTAPTYTSLAYNTAVSPYVWAMASSFVLSTTQNTLYILNPAASYGVIGQYDLSTGVDTAREINLDKDGNLFVSANGSKMYVLPNAAATAASLNTGSIVQWNTVASGSAFAAFNGFDIGFAAASLPGDYNNNGKVDGADYVVWRNGGSPDSSVAGYNLWRANFGNGSPGAGSGLDGGAVPEPATAMLLLVGLAAFASRRRVS